MLGRIFKRKEESLWETSLNRGVLVRTCRRTGKLEYRDCKHNKWVSLESEDELKSVQKELYYTAPLAMDH
ncbi:MAG: hypothetical protein ABW153_08240 [Sedimenticola sp.]